jgi:P4 family phage/plasmid primase-like protien
MASLKTFNALDKFLFKHKMPQGGQATHTQLPSRDLCVYAGSFEIKLPEMDEFYTVYKEHVFAKGLQAYLTEQQLEEGPLMIDLDLRYHLDVLTRQHTPQHVHEFAGMITSAVRDILNYTTQTVPIYVMEKETVNTVEGLTKDGLHIVVPIKMDRATKTLFRNYLIDAVQSSVSWMTLGHQDTVDKLFDRNIMLGHTLWQLYGSRKPGEDVYLLTYLYEIRPSLSSVPELVHIDDINLSEYAIANFHMLTARNYPTNLLNVPLNPNFQIQYNAIVASAMHKTNSAATSLTRTVYDSKRDHPELLESIEEVRAYWEDFKKYRIRPNEFNITEAHDYAMILPSEYYSDRDKWIRVGWALKNTDDRLFVAWLEFSSQWDRFDFNNVHELYRQWRTFQSRHGEGLTHKSIIYWAKVAAPEKYAQIRKDSIGKYIKEAIASKTDTDLAAVLFHMNKEDYVCATIKDSQWYAFIENRWQPTEQGYMLRREISNGMFDTFNQVLQDNVQKTDGKREFAQVKGDMHDTGEVARCLKNTSKKNNIMREATEFFYDRNFLENLDCKKHLLGCVNGVLDFSIASTDHPDHFRFGRHDDYISMSSRMVYIKLSDYQKSERHQQTIREVNEFMEQLFPDDDLREYMWQHLASTLVGSNENQTFNIYTGSGANGKSKIVELMGKVLGEYKATVPVTLITQKRNAIGSVSPEVYQLKGVRYAVMQEPSKGDCINEGILKELTGSDPIQCRALYKDTVTFVPDFKLVVCANTLFDIKNIDDEATWRRIRVVDFKSKFVKEPYVDISKEDCPYQFHIDPKLDQKFERWAPIFFSMLVEKVFQTRGIVTDCPSVMGSSQRYRESQDVFAEFIKENITVHTVPQPKKLKINLVNDTFKSWFASNHTGSAQPKMTDVKAYFVKRFGAYPRDGWAKLSIKDEENDEE